uniref:Uncharacterized protein n=1 Tax=Setaria digitata TaxID=48799 RepID=A0A915PHH8_9BILA
MASSSTNNTLEQSKDLVLFNPQTTASFATVPQLCAIPQPFIPYYNSLLPQQYPPFPPYLSCSSNAVMTVRQQKCQNKKMFKPSKTHFWCAGIAQLLWTVVIVVGLGLFAILILALLVI